MNHLKIDHIPKMPSIQKGARGALKANTMERLQLGDIKCGGWLAHQLELMSDGMTGRLYEYGPFFTAAKNGFLDPQVKCGWEEVPYWFRGFYPLAVQTGDERLLSEAQKYIEAFIASKEPDGWFGPKYLKTFVGKDGVEAPDLFPAMLLFDTLIMYYEISGDERIPELIGGFFDFCKRLPDDKFLPATLSRLKWQKIRAGDMLPSLYWYYERTGDESIVELAKRFYNGIYKSNMEYIAHHIVDFAQRFAYDGIYSRLSGNPEHMRKTEYAYDSFRMIWGQMPRGIFAGDEQIRPGCTDPRQGFEPCAMVELAKNFYELGRISGETIYADRAEDVMLNHFTASFSEDYRQMHYLTSSNLPILSNANDHNTQNGTTNHGRSFEIFTPNNRCCGHNHGMGWTWYGANLWQRTPDGGLAAWLYAESEVKTKLDDSVFGIREKTDYPFSGDISLTVTENGAVRTIPLYFRIPRWSRGATLRLNGNVIHAEKSAGGFIRVEREWQKDDVISISFDMEISFTKWRTNGSVTVDRGPLSYSVKIGEEYKLIKEGEAGDYNNPEPHLWENYEVLPTTPWNYGLTSELDVSLSSAQAVKPMPWTLENAPILLKAKAKRIDNWGLQNDTCAELQQSPVFADAAEEEIELVPLGCARLRISCLPVVTDDKNAPTWKKVPEDLPIEDRAKNFPVPYKA